MASKKRPGPQSTEPREPTICEMREQAARSGDVETLWSELTMRHFSMVDQEEIFGHLLRAIEVRCRQDPEAFAAENFSRMIGFVSYLTLRATFYASHRIARHGRATRDNGPADFPPEVAERLIPRLMDLQGHLTELLASQASVARQYALIHARRAENGRCVGGVGKVNGHTKPTKAPGAKPRKASGKDKSNGKSNGHIEPVILDVGPVNRIGRYLNGDGSASNGVHGDD